MSALRLRLAFDYPPPLLPVARMCWFLLQPEHCRVVADLESIIRQRFGFSSRTRLHLFVDSCLLPPNESVQLVRDNDCVRVQQEELITENGFVNSNSPDRPSVKLKKRRRQQSADKHESQSESGHKKKRVAGLSSEQRDDSTAETVSAANGESLKKRKKTESDGNDNIQKKHKKKKDKSRKDQTSRDHSNRRARPESLEKVLSEPTAVIPLSKQGEGKNASNNCSSQRKARAQAMDSKSLSSESDHPSPKDPQLATVGTITKSEGKGSSAKKSPNSRNRKRPVQPNITTEMAESSSDSPSSDPETPMVKKAFALKPGTLSSVERISGLSKTGDPNTARSSSEASSDSEDSESESKPTGTDTVMRGKADNEGHEATTAVLQSDQVGNSNFGQGNGRGRGRGFGGFPWRGRQQCGALRGRGRGAGIFYYNYECSQETKPGESKETVTNKHVIVENLPEVPMKDYSKLPLLAAPPQVGERIAFKMLELSANYTPELSDYKEGRLLSYNPVTQQVELCVDSISRESPKEPGKFDLIYQTESGEDMVEYAVMKEPQITESWSSLVEPRLIVAPAEPVTVDVA